MNDDATKIDCVLQAHDVDFLEEGEHEAYAAALYAATKWGEKIDKEKKPDAIRQLKKKYDNK